LNEEVHLLLFSGVVVINIVRFWAYYSRSSHCQHSYH